MIRGLKSSAWSRRTGQNVLSSSVLRGLHSALSLLTLATAWPALCHGQRTFTALTVGATWLDFSGLGGVLGASGEVRVGRTFRETLAFDLAGLAVVPLGGVSAIPDCVPGVPCIQRKTPDLLWGALASISRRVNSGPFWPSAGVGVLTETGMKGPGSHTSAIGALGLHWFLRQDSGLTPTLGVRAMGLASSVGGLRYIILPSVGVMF